MLDDMRATLREEARAIEDLAERLGEEFETVGRLILECEGRVVASGIGKAGDIAKKFSSTLSSTGTRSFFLHPADAMHGDLGMIGPEDLVIMFSNSGETEEVLRLFPPLRQIGVTTILVTGRVGSTAAKMADHALDIGIGKEACPHNLAPTTSTTVMLALSDALALAVMTARNFSREDYARIHPAGALGRRLLMRVSDAMRTGPDAPMVGPNAAFVEALTGITKARAGAACVVDESQKLLGLIADGDIRRHILSGGLEILQAPASEVMTPDPVSVEASMPAIEALELFESSERKVGEFPVTEDGRVVGIILLKDLIRLGLT
jgi:arabinose-5-phosphate isomerase